MIASDRTREAETLFSRHLDLRPLGRRRRGNVRCRFHPDRTASLSVDLTKGVFNCFGCGEHGGLVRFAELVGERQPRSIAVFPRRGESPLDTARREILREARSQPWASEGARLLYDISDWIRLTRRKVHELRRFAEQQDSAECDEILGRAALIETFAHAIEAELDDVLSTGRIDE